MKDARMYPVISIVLVLQYVVKDQIYRSVNHIVKTCLRGHSAR